MTKISEPFQIIVNDNLKFAIEPEQATRLDITSLPDGRFHILNGNKKYLAEVVETHYAERAFSIRVNGLTFKINIAGKYEQLIQEMGLTVGASHKINEIKAPMPGLVLDILVQEGQVVQKGDTLLILEAMKMENVIKSAGDGVVKSISIKQGMAVEKGAMLMRFE